MNDLAAFASVFDGVERYAGTPPAGLYADWLGAITDARFRAYTGMRPEEVGGCAVTRTKVALRGWKGRPASGAIC